MRRLYESECYEIMEVLKLIIIGTTMMSRAKTPSAPMTLPTTTTVLKSMKPNDEDCPNVRDLKAAGRENREGETQWKLMEKLKTSFKNVQLLTHVLRLFLMWTSPTVTESTNTSSQRM